MLVFFSVSSCVEPLVHYIFLRTVWLVVFWVLGLFWFGVWLCKLSQAVDVAGWLPGLVAVVFGLCARKSVRIHYCVPNISFNTL